MTSATDRTGDDVFNTARKVADEVKESARTIADNTKDAAFQEISALRAKVEALMAERVTPALTKAAGQAEELAHDAGAAVRQRAEQVAGTVREQPLTAIGAAALAGLAIGLLMRR